MNIKSSILSFLVITFLFSLGLNAQQLAFPGAEGYGKYVSGGRGDGENGKLAIVTNLEDDPENPPEGSFRWALRQGMEVKTDPILGTYSVQRPLTIVFKVGGVIHLKDELRAKRNNLTIAGQTAPGDGIVIRGHTVNLGGSYNVIVRYIRFRPGDEEGAETSALRIENGGNFIIDHCSNSWAIEETQHFSHSANFTVQWNIISESLYNSFHKKGARGYGSQWGGQYASYHHNLMAHHNSRMPRINGSNEDDVEALIDYRNNVNYNWGSKGAFYGGEWMKTGGIGFAHTNVVNNYFIPGPATSSEQNFARPSQGDLGYAKWFFHGNIMQGDDAKSHDNWLGVSADYVGSLDSIRSDEEFIQSDGVIEDYENYTEHAIGAFNSVMKYAGAILPKRDTIDARVIAEAKGEIPIVRFAYVDTAGQESPIKGLGSGLIDTQRNLVPDDASEGTTPWDVYTYSNEAPIDSDNDGMPDLWELDHNLNPNDFNDFKLIADNGYTNLENYLNSVDVVITASRELKNEIGFSIYPNPVKDKIWIKSLNPVTNVSIYDMSGNILVSVKNPAGIKSIPTNNLGSGIYLMKAVSNSNQIFIEKMIK